MIVPKKGIELIKKYEGFKDHAYICPAGKLTIGYGTAEVYPSTNNEIQKTDRINEADAEFELVVYCKKYIMPLIEKCVNKLQEKGICLCENQICALMSLLYNIGTNSFYHSKCFEAFCNLKTEESKKQWDWGINQYRKEPSKFIGLKKRRNEEIELFFGVKDYWK